MPIIKAHEYRLNKSDECYLEHDIDLRYNPSFTSDEISSHIYQIRYEFHYFTATSNGSKKIEIQFYFTRMQPATNNIVYPHYYDPGDESDDGLP